MNAIESYYLETRDRLFFAVKGFEHPPGRFIAVLRYAPDPGGGRKKDGASFRRFYHFPEQEEFLRNRPGYLAFDPVFQTILQSVPEPSIRRVYDPRARLQELAALPTRGGVTEDAIAFVRLLRQKAGVPLSSLGITGSLLIGLHGEPSDLDVAVFGTKPCVQVYRGLKELLDSGSCPEVRRPNAREMKELFAQRVVDTHMDFSQFAAVEKSKVNQGSFRGRTYFIRFLKEAHEVECYGRLHYTPLSRVSITARIADNRDAIYTPCRYSISDVRCLEGSLPPDLIEIVSFRGRFCEQARAGQYIMASGALERVQDIQGEAWYRLLLGNSPADTMIPWRGQHG
jgi:uncharacterized protein